MTSPQKKSGGVANGLPFVTNATTEFRIDPEPGGCLIKNNAHPEGTIFFVRGGGGFSQAQLARAKVEVAHQFGRAQLACRRSASSCID